MSSVIKSAGTKKGGHAYCEINPSPPNNGDKAIQTRSCGKEQQHRSAGAAGGFTEAVGGCDGGGDGTASPVSMVLGFAITYKTPSNPTGMSQAMVAF